MDKKIKLLGKLTVAYFLLIGICFLIYILVVTPESGADKVSAIMGLLGWSATIFTPIAAYLLLDSWKDQRKYELEYEYLSNIIKNLKPIYEELIIIRGNSLIIKNTNEKLILYNDFITRSNLNFQNVLLSLYPDIKIYSKIKKDDFLEKIYLQFDKKCFQIQMHYTFLIGFYSEYYDQSISINLIYKNKGNTNDIKEKMYSYSDQLNLKEQIIKIDDFFKEDRVGTLENKIFYFKFLNHLEETI
ncbi:hypothetical protein AY606_08275 [Acinetobacter sp. SFB]|uniref:hypothetical protein n=1 Tax=Acinetobacter sp. SFB TaxID=1805634 RepID=UPI0007D85752|nr:hypothetical protein [Acinetobacter sp. SFB]OAL78418.1 hypothetical protein AY606_08275 [Acinetobacter sp. SFB]